MNRFRTMMLAGGILLATHALLPSTASATHRIPCAPEVRVSKGTEVQRDFGPGYGMDLGIYWNAPGFANFGDRPVASGNVYPNQGRPFYLIYSLWFVTCRNGELRVVENPTPLNYHRSYTVSPAPPGTSYGRPTGGALAYGTSPAKAARGARRGVWVRFETRLYDAETADLYARGELALKVPPRPRTR